MMSCGPVTACATDTPPTLRILAATSRAFPGDVSIKINAFTDMIASSRRAMRHRVSMGSWRNQTALLIVFIKAPPTLAPEISCIHVLLQQRARTILVVAEHSMHHLHNREASVEP